MPRPWRQSTKPAEEDPLYRHLLYQEFFLAIVKLPVLIAPTASKMPVFISMALLPIKADTEPCPDTHCSEWATDTDNQGPWNGNTSSSDIRSLKFTLGDHQDDADESLSIDHLGFYVR